MDRTCVRRLASDGIALWLAHVRPRVRELLERTGAADVLGREHIYPRVADGIIAFSWDTPGAKARVDVLADVVADLRDRQAQKGMRPDGPDLLADLAARLARELAAGDRTEGAPAERRRAPRAQPSAA